MHKIRFLKPKFRVDSLYLPKSRGWWYGRHCLGAWSSEKEAWLEGFLILAMKFITHDKPVTVHSLLSYHVTGSVWHCSLTLCQAGIVESSACMQYMSLISLSHSYDCVLSQFTGRHCVIFNCEALSYFTIKINVSDNW